MLLGTVKGGECMHDKVLEERMMIVEELETNLMSLVIFITLNMCSTCFGH